MKFHNFKQFDLSVDDYTREFEYLMLKCDVVEPKKQTIARYLGGLKKEIAEVIKLQWYWTFNDVRKLALIVEQQRKDLRRYATKSMWSTSYGITGNPGASSSKLAFNKASTTNKPETKNDKPTNTSNALKKCFKCQGYGHIASECPNRKVITIVENEVVEEEEEEE